MLYALTKTHEYVHARFFMYISVACVTGQLPTLFVAQLLQLQDVYNSAQFTRPCGD